ncbi:MULTISPECIES: protein adenylyltransferase SelO [unclassified Prochlorococcus]|uniref:protein adenylyltransferase SelO n=1 Tax=unclassified Prochlorococcus TaxID=2627481 RepID=UPI00055D0D6F|nr:MULTISPECIES: YdiU family protein [unclassified Prochlorococcus]
MTNLLLALNFEPQIESLGSEYWDVVDAARFPRTELRFRNDALLRQLGIEPDAVENHHLEQAYGCFEARTPLLALRYHGYQFGTYNPLLGDGRGFLYGQLRDRFGQLQDLGTKGSGTTPWSRGGDGRLTLKGGVREIIASEALHRLGVTTSRTLCLVETGEKLWRGDEPSPTRSSVMMRMARTHLRFGTCERLLHLRDAQSLERLLRHVVDVYYPLIAAAYPVQEGNAASAIEAQLLAFYAELVERVARLTAEWMAAGFTHGVLNTDNMSLLGESFDYGPFAFFDQWEPGFTAAYFDQTGLYAYGRQPGTCHNNLRLLQEPLAMLLPRQPMEQSLETFAPIYQSHYRACMQRRLGLPSSSGRNGNVEGGDDAVRKTLALLAAWPVGYGAFFAGLAAQISTKGLPEEPEALLPVVLDAAEPARKVWLDWRDRWWTQQREAVSAEPAEAQAINARLQRWNLVKTPIRSVIEEFWQAIDQDDDWQPLQAWLKTISVE